MRSGRSKPGQTFVEVRYEGYWFWIEHSDLASKYTLSFMQLITALGERAPADGQPLVTVQAGNQ